MVKVEYSNYLTGRDVKEGEEFEIVLKPKYVDIKRGDELVKKLCLTLKLPNNDTKEYLPNNTSIKLIVKALGDEADAWINHFLMFKKANQMFKGELQEVLYANVIR